ncbi:hypothetical protein KKD52_08175 [Myxococcota bacterium]|nr:hypothetical protein [Myxococcota bacterium]MBU1411908.1 hypothetical protein [Myxococcota bacterium]MBU1510325.1 hypothetical protein [Myxococcota bacterium]PKN25215.1 MAG: hypothetical protein CVU65_09520 [Deltaproteobacteria bacterium HGW-Deltaproteobacteria-22]
MNRTPEELEIQACMERMKHRDVHRKRRIPGWVQVALLGAGLSLAACKSAEPAPGNNANINNINDKDILDIEDDYSVCDYSASFDDYPDFVNQD